MLCFLSMIRRNSSEVNFTCKPSKTANGSALIQKIWAANRYRLSDENRAEKQISHLPLAKQQKHQLNANNNARSLHKTQILAKHIPCWRKRRYPTLTITNHPNNHDDQMIEEIRHNNGFFSSFSWAVPQAVPQAERKKHGKKRERDVHIPWWRREKKRPTSAAVEVRVMRKQAARERSFQRGRG